jgi:hypothetical protein
MMQMYPDVEQLSWCAGGNYNVHSINFEISGVYFDEVINNPNHARYEELVARSDRAIDIACWAIRQYGIDPQEVYGHYEIQEGKSDPGPAYLAYFKNRVLNECR